MPRTFGSNLFLSLFIASISSVFIGNCTEDHSLKEHWLDGPTSEIKSCLSPELEDEERESCRFYAAVIDAGSTGTRLHLFEFSHDNTHEHSPFKVENEIFNEVKPGLSSFAIEPAKAAESVRGLIEKARKTVPPQLWQHTLIVMKATAGLRLLPDEQADEILRDVEEVIKKSGLLLDDGAVGILSGTDEGVFGWFTLNYLTGKIKNLSTNARRTSVALDLGGGSTQITFVPEDIDAVFNDDVPENEFSHTLRIFGTSVKLYTHSYLGNGLVAARLGIGHLLESDDKTRKIVTHCFPKNYTLTDWDYAGNGWTVSATPEAGYENCLTLTRRYIEETNIRRISGFAQRDVYIFAYYYDRAEQAGIVRKNGEPIKVIDYATAAQSACSIPGSKLEKEHWRPWQFLDLCYIYSLLHDGYGLPDDQLVHPTKKLQKMEVSWALGAGYHILNTYHDKQHSYSNDLCEETGKPDNKTAANSTYIAQIYEFLSETTTQLLTVLRIIS